MTDFNEFIKKSDEEIWNIITKDGISLHWLAWQLIKKIRDLEDMINDLENQENDQQVNMLEVRQDLD